MTPEQFAADLAQTADELRTFAEARQASRVVTMRKTGGTTEDADGYEVPEWATVHVDLPVRFPAPRGGASRSREVTLGGIVLTLGVREMHAAFDTEDLADGDMALVTTGRSVGSVWQIVDATPPPDDATAYRLDVIAADRPEEWL